MTKVEALKELAKTFGMTNVTGDTVAEVIESMSANYDDAPKELILTSSTPDSVKKFKITVDDTGSVTASEIGA